LNNQPNNKEQTDCSFNQSAFLSNHPI